MDMMHPTLTTLLVSSPESYALVAMVVLGIIAIAVSILLSEAIAFYWSSRVREVTTVRTNKKAC